MRILLNGQYKKSAELQRIFDRAISDSDYKIWLHFYVINEYLSDDIITLIDDFMIKLFLIYQKAEAQKKKNDNRHPIPYYLLGFMGYSFKNKSFDEINLKLDSLFSDKNIFDEIYNFYANLVGIYSKEYIRTKKSDYNFMIKQEIDISLFEHSLGLLQSLDNYTENVEHFINE